MIEKSAKKDGKKLKFDLKKFSKTILLNVSEKNFKLSSGIKENSELVQNFIWKTLVKKSKNNKKNELDNKFIKIFKDLTFKSAKEYNVKRENANIDADTPMGTMLKYGSESAKHFFELCVLDHKFSKAHRNGDIHIHDLDFLALTTTCCQIDLIKLFENGFYTGHGFLREPNDITSYAALTCIAIQSNQNEQHGGQSVPNFDYALALGVKKTFKKLYLKNLEKAFDLLIEDTDSQLAGRIITETCNLTGDSPKIDMGENYLNLEFKNIFKYTNDEKLTKKIQNFAYKNTLNETDVKIFQSMEALVHNLNTMHSRAGAQVPFSSINYGTDTSPEGRLIIKNVLLATENGLGNSETPIFPVHIFKVKEGVNYNPDDKNYDLFKLACKVSAKRLFPNFAFLDSKFNLKYYKKDKPETEIAYMGCRTRVIANNYDSSKETIYGRGNLSFTSINLPRLAILSKKNINKFYELLNSKVNLVTEQLLARFELQASKKVKNYPFLMGQGVWMDSDKLNINDEVREVLKHGTLTIGFIGLAECLKSLTDFHHGENKDSQKLGLEIIKFMREKTDKFCEKYKMNFSLIATPAEGLSGKFVELDKKRFGNIIGVTDKEFYTNSFHIPVDYEISIYDKIYLEAPYHEFTNGGHISYVELDGDPNQNLEAFEKIIRTMKEAGIGYGSINHPVDRDPVCGYTGVIGDVCPKCGRTDKDSGIKIERIRRITGYLVGSLDRFNNAKLAEVKKRVKHKFGM
ncbi:MAG: anaerobic ribonucleoside triphosphate reductase [Candidatus Paraimprobicoccus trichonymphae]|uniref:Anaerobic ribonucleoside triphosphate reductase n=1 Tax=Candidatus Paraimprobicoccus trichonymphae TaxID=3033793 RepID=A0AA48IAJ4_9FIRM|nr:MAG: anaerobic ribonucleoside triphosphate reductase [Candidatus Paraimprobicoccus trichonymphae]